MHISPESVRVAKKHVGEVWREESEKIPKWFFYRAMTVSFILFILGIGFGIYTGYEIWGR